MATTTVDENPSLLLFGLFPAACMFGFTVLGLGTKVPENLAGALQHFAAGLLLSAIGTELLPILLRASGFWENLGATIGFFSGMGVLILLGAILPDNDDDGAKSEESEPERDPRALVRRRSSSAGSIRALSATARIRSSTVAKAIHQDYVKALSERGQHIPNEVANLLEETTRTSITISADMTTPTTTKTLPWSFLVAVVVDSFLDGFLIGITGLAGPSTTTIMAASLSVEMSFVGLTLATACYGMPWQQSMPASLAGPLTLVLGTVLGNLLSIVVEGNPSLLAGIMGFGTSALLFMVAEELLLEAHEDGGHVWWVDVQLYTGFYWGFLSTKFLPA